MVISAMTVSGALDFELGSITAVLIFSKKGFSGFGFRWGSSTGAGRAVGSSLRRDKGVGWGVDAYNIINNRRNSLAFESPTLSKALFFIPGAFSWSYPLISLFGSVYSGAR